MTTSNLETKLHQKGINPTAMRLLVLDVIVQTLSDSRVKF